MPGLLKDRAAGRLGRLISALRPARAGPLPVQTGFPTSLADLFVKNHGRLRKPSSAASRRKKRAGAPPSPSPPPSPPPASSPSPPPPPAAVAPPIEPRLDLPPAEPVCHAGGGSLGLGLGFLALVGVVMSLAILVICSRRVVAAVTVAAFSLFLLDPIRSLAPRRRPRPPAAAEALDFRGRGYVSPIREAEAPGRSCSDLSKGTDVVSVLSTDDTTEERSEAADESSSSKPKRRSWKKLIPRRLQRGRIRKEEAADSPSVSFRSESSEAEANAIARATDHPDSRRGSRRREADAAANSSDSSGPRDGTGAGTDAEARNGGGPVGIDVSADLAGADKSRLPFVGAVVVVLAGLVAGRLPAVALTVLFVSSLQRFSSCRGVIRSSP